MTIIHGNTGNLKAFVREKLQHLYELTVPMGQISTHELNEAMLEITDILGREVAVYLTRQGRVEKCLSAIRTRSICRPLTCARSAGWQVSAASTRIRAAIRA